MTTMAELLDDIPGRDATVSLYLERCAAALSADVSPGVPTAEELAIAAHLDDEFVSDRWLGLKTSLPRPGVKIHEDVQVIGGSLKAPGGLIRATGTLVAGSLRDVAFSGDFTILPASGLAALEGALVGNGVDFVALEQRLNTVYAELSLETPGVIPEHFVRALMGG
jgi:hypothetical protein